MSNTVVPVPVSTRDHAAVAVATPDARDARFNKVRSAMRSTRVGPCNVASTVPGVTVVPSLTANSTDTPEVSNRRAT